MTKDFGSPCRLLRRHPTMACVWCAIYVDKIAGDVGRHSPDRLALGL